MQRSTFQNTDLLLAMCAGQGQCGVITRATVNMIPAPQFARVYRMPYTDVPTLFSDIRILIDRGGQPGGFDWVASVNAGGPLPPIGLWAAIFFDQSAPPPSNAYLMRGTSVTAQTAPFVFALTRRALRCSGSPVISYADDHGVCKRGNLQTRGKARPLVRRHRSRLIV